MKNENGATSVHHHVWLALGANLGDPAGTIAEAIVRISLLPGTRLLARSSFYRTAPVGHTDQPDFVNAAVEITTTLAPEALLGSLQSIERALGRQRRPLWHEREIDIDLLLYDSVVIEGESLSIPHPHMHTRAFVLVPLEEIAPELRHPGLGTTVRDMLEALDKESNSWVRRISPEEKSWAE